MGEDASRVISARAVTVTGILASAWAGDRTRPAISYKTVIPVSSANTIQTHPYQHASLSFNRDRDALMI
jgi:hypothetical protein